MTAPAGPGGAPVEAPPTCYRHPDRETYVRCTRCERPICPDCMNAAAVGFQCPDCVAAGRRTTVTPRTAFGGRIARRGPVLTQLLIGINVLVFLAELASPTVQARYAMVPADVAAGQYYRLLTAAFLHGGVLHIAFNMWALYVVGTQLEPLLGRARYLALYLLSALGGSVLSYLVGPVFGGSVGASGAIFGLFGALLVVGRRLRADVGPIVGVIGINLVLTFLVPNIDWRAHVGGLVTGALLAAAFAYAPRRLRAPVAIVACAVVVAALAVLVVVRTGTLGVPVVG